MRAPIFGPTLPLSGGASRLCRFGPRMRPDRIRGRSGIAPCAVAMTSSSPNGAAGVAWARGQARSLPEKPIGWPKGVSRPGAFLVGGPGNPAREWVRAILAGRSPQDPHVDLRDGDGPDCFGLTRERPLLDDRGGARQAVQVLPPSTGMSVSLMQLSRAGQERDGVRDGLWRHRCAVGLSSSSWSADRARSAQLTEDRSDSAGSVRR